VGINDQRLRWQSWLVLAAVLPWCAVASLRYAMATRNRATQTALAISLGLALLVFLARAATPLAALTGGVITAALTLGFSPWYRSALPALLALFALTLTATRFGRAQKQQLGVAEDKRGRNAAQVAANLGVAGLAAAVVLSHRLPGTWYGVIVIAALAEATADTLASELGEVLGGHALTAGLGAVAGLFVDSLLGATAERRGWLNNDAVNFLSTLAASAIAAGASALQ
jgi:uncharacterized membrane protein